MTDVFVRQTRPLFLNRLPLPRLTKYQAQLVCEGIGTLIFVMNALLTEMSCGVSAIDTRTHTQNLAPIGQGLMLSVLIYTFAYISGGHFNPAVTFSALLLGEMRIDEVMGYWTAQVLGGVAGALLGAVISDNKRPLPAPQIFHSTPEYVFLSFFSELIFTFLFITVMLHLSHKRSFGDRYYGLMVGVFFGALYYTIGGVSRGTFNPAVATALQLAKLIMSGYASPLLFLWIYWIGPVCGAGLGTFLFTMTRPVPVVEKEPPSEERTVRTLYS